jgi:2'-5' RNA ligase
LYRPFIDDPAHIALLEGQRYVVLRPNGAVQDAYTQVRERVQDQLAGLEVSYPAQPHVTLAGFGKGTSLAAVRELVANWAPTVPPLRLVVEKLGVFPSPFQIIIVRVQRTPELSEALTTLREQAGQHRLVDVATVQPSDWIFHMSVAYCSALSAAAWTDVAAWVETVSVAAAECTVTDVEIVAIDNGQEYSAGLLSLSAPRPNIIREVARRS